MKKLWKFDPEGPIGKSSWVNQVMDWRRTGANPLPQTMINLIRPEWDKGTISLRGCMLFTMILSHGMFVQNVQAIIYLTEYMYIVLFSQDV